MTDITYDVAVVGAGLMGSSAAYHLSKSGANVLLLEQYHFLHRRGSSHGESRIIRHTYPSKAYTALMKHSYDLWHAAEAESGVRVLVKTGGIDIINTTLPIYTALIDACKENKVEIDVLSPRQLKLEYGLEVPENCVGVRQADSGILHATTAVSMFQQLAMKHGAKLRDNAKVVSRITEGTVERLELADGSVVRAKKVIFACGPWAKPVLKDLCDLSLPLQVWQTATMYFKPLPECVGAMAAMEKLPVLIDYGVAPLWTSSVESVSVEAPAEPSIYSCPSKEFPGLIKFAVHRGTCTTADERTFEPMVEDCVAPVSAWLATHIPFLDPTPVSRETCLYTMSPDEDFIIDVHPENPNIFVAAGFSGHGFKFGSLVGKILSDLALNGTTVYDIAMFSIKRDTLTP